MADKEKERRRRGKAETESRMWWRRYTALRHDGFAHVEAYSLAERRIGTPAMLKGRKLRRKWFKETIEGLGMSEAEIAEAVSVMYENMEWSSEYEQFYPEEFRMSTYEGPLDE